MFGELNETTSERLQKKVSQLERLADLAKQHKGFMGFGGDITAYVNTMAAYDRLAESIAKEREEGETE